MTLSFQRLSPEQTRQHYPRYYREDISCFLIVKDTPTPSCTPVGLYGLIDRGCDPLTGENQGEGFLTIFPAFQFRVLNKRFFAALFDHALSCGFAKVYTWTRLPSWQKLFQRFESLGIERLDSPPEWDEERSEDSTKENSAQDYKVNLNVNSKVFPNRSPKVWFSKRKEG